MNKPKIPVRSRRKLITATLLATAAFQGASYADLLKIGVNFLGRDQGPEPVGGGTANTNLAFGDVAGVAPYAQADWNNLGNNVPGESTGDFSNPPMNVTSGALFTDDGLAGSRGVSTVTVTVQTNDAWNSETNPIDTPDRKLMKGLVKAGNPVGSILTLTVNNLDPAKLYDFVAYTAVNNAGARGDLTLAGASTFATYYVQEENAFDGTFTLGNSTNPAARSIESDYSLWNSVSPDDTGKLTLSIRYDGGGDGFGLPGFQVFELAPAIVGEAYWNFGAGTGTWDTATLNWRATNTGGSSDTAFVANNAANFGDLGTAGARVVDVVAGGVSPGATFVTNSAGNDYTIQGGPILGAGVLTKDGAGALTLTGANEFSGAVTIKHGAVNVTTIGDAAGAGNLGKGSLITIGDTGTNDAVLNYGGVTATVARSVVMSGNGGTVNIATGGVVVTLNNLSGTGQLTKAGAGDLVFTGPTSTHTGSISVNAGNLTVETIGNGAGQSLSLNGGTSFNVTSAGSQTDGRSLTLNGNASLGVTNATGNYALTGDLNSTNVLTKTGSGRLELAGAVTLTQLPVISAGTLALTKEGAIDLPNGAISLAGGQRLEVVPGALDGANPVTLNGGALRVGHQGLQAYYFTGGYDQGNWLDRMNGTAFGVAGSHAELAGLGVPFVAARTNTGGQTNLDFTNANFGGGAPFLNQGVTATDNIRAIFTGKIRIDAAGDTTFFTRTDDGSSIFIDGQRVVLNNAFQGQTTRQGTINLSAGFHDFLMYFYEGGGGAGLLAEWDPVNGPRQTIPNSVLYSGDTVNYTATPITVTAPSTIESGAAMAQLGALTLPANTLLTVNGSATFTGTTLTGAAHQVAVTGFNANTSLGILSGPTSLTKSGNGNLVFIAPAPVGTTLAVNEGGLVSMATAGVDPLAGIPIAFADNTSLGLSSLSGDATFNTPVPTGLNFTIAAGSFGNDNIVAPSVVTLAPATIVAGAGNTLSLRSNNQNFTLAITPQITGTGNVVTEEGTVLLNGGVNNVGGNFSNRIANVTVNGNVSTNALLQQGNYLNLGNNLISGQIVPGSTTINGTLNATSVTNTRGTLTVTGLTTNTGPLTLNGNGTTNLAASTHTQADLSGGATLNANGAFTTPGAMTIAASSANLNAVSSVSNVALTAGGNLIVRGSLNTTTPDVNGAGVTAVQASNLRFDAGAGNTATVTGGDISLTNQSNFTVNSGTADLSAVAIKATPLIVTLNTNALGARLVDLDAARLDPRDPNLVNGIFAGTTNPPTTASRSLTQALSFANDGAVRDFFGVTNNEVDRFTAIFYGRYTPFIDGPTTFGMQFHDDNGAIWVDSNRNGLFETAEKVLDSGCCPGNVDGAAVSLTAGLNYNVLFGVEDTGGGGSIGARMTYNVPGDPDPVPVPNATINPADPTQAGFFSYFSSNGAGANLQVDSGAILTSKSIEGITNLRVANTGSVVLTNKGASTASSADSLLTTGATANVLLGDNNVLTVGQIVLNPGGSLTIDSAPGATTGGRVVVSGTVSGLAADSDIGTGSINVQDGTLLVNAPVVGTGTVFAAISGTIGGTGSLAGPVSVGTGGVLAPGDLGIGVFTVGSADLAQGTLALEALTTASHDRLVVSTGGTLQLGGTLTVSFLTGSGIQVNDVLYIVDNQGASATSGIFNGVPDQGIIDLGNGYTAAISYDAAFNTSFATGGNDVALQLVTIPEPGAAVAILSGLGLLMGFQRFRRRA